MSNKAQRVGHTARGEAECCMVPQDPTLSALHTCTAHTVHNLLCFHTKLFCMTKVAVLYDSYSVAVSFAPPTQNTIGLHVSLQCCKIN